MDVRLNFNMDIIEQIKKKLDERPIDRVEITSLLLLFEPDNVVSAAVEIRKRSLIENNPSGAINALGVYLLSSLFSKNIKGFEKIRPLLRDMYSPLSNTKRKAVKKRSKTPRPYKPTQRNPKRKRSEVVPITQHRQYKTPDNKNALQIFSILKKLEQLERHLPQKDKVLLNSFRDKFYSEPNCTEKEYNLIKDILDNVQKEIKNACKIS